MTHVASSRVLLAAVESLPAVRAARDRLHRCAAGGGDLADLVHVVESDVALAIAVLRLANHGPQRGSVASTAEAVRKAGPARLRALAERIPATDPLSGGCAEQALQHFRLHCLAVQATMDRLAVATDHGERDELLTAALLHDIGKLVLSTGQNGGEVADPGLPPADPEARVLGERERYGTDHAAVGAELARHIGLPDRLADAIAAHHSASGGCAGMVRLADMLTLYAQGWVVDLTALVELSTSLGIGREQLGRLMYELPQPMTSTRTLQPCPLSAREVEVLKRLADGEVYKQIGAALGLSASTIRSHLHRIYSRIGVTDRTQAVLLARKSGWI